MNKPVSFAPISFERTLVIPEPGTRVEEGAVTSISCAVLNDLQARVNIPAVVVDMIMKNSGVTELLWPLGLYVGFTAEGMSVGAYGRDASGKVVHGIAQEKFSETEPPPMGTGVWDLWKRLKRPPFDLTFNIVGNYQRLLNATRERHNLTSD